jgi:predicted transposase YdaD
MEQKALFVQRPSAMGERDIALRMFYEDRVGPLLAGLLPEWTIEVLSVEPTELKAVERRADLVHRVHLDGAETILHIEFQSRHERRLPIRMALYQALLRERHWPLPVFSLVIYLMHEPPSRPVPRGVFQPSAKEPLQFGYAVFCPWEKPLGIEVIRSHPLVAPLAALTPGITNENMVLLRTAVDDSGLPEELRRDLLVVTRILASRRFPRALLESYFRSEHMEDSPYYQEILREGEKRGLAKGEKRGLAKGERMALKRTILDLVEARLGRKSKKLQKQLGAMEADALHGLWIKLLRAKDEARFRSLLPR